MTEAMAVIIGAVVGTIGGLAGGGFASFASWRSSQLSVRVALVPTIHEIGTALVRVRITRLDTDEHLDALVNFEIRWNEFSIQQRILCPSKRIENLMDLVRATTKDRSAPPEALLALGGQAVDKVTRMIGAHTNQFFRFQARKDEATIIRDWLASPDANLLSQTVRKKLADLA